MIPWFRPCREPVKLLEKAAIPLYTRKKLDGYHIGPIIFSSNYKES